MTLLDMEAIAAAPVAQEPYPHMRVCPAVHTQALAGLIRDFPTLAGPGSFPLAACGVKGQFAALVEELESSSFREVISRKFAIDLSSKPTFITVRGACRASDGAIHTDSPSKIITILLYLNHQWEDEGGRLKILSSGDSLDSAVGDISPCGGNLLVFRRGENSWHGHAPYEGVRRVVQMNWMTSHLLKHKEFWRHRLSTAVKKVLSRASPL